MRRLIISTLAVASILAAVASASTSSAQAEDITNRIEEMRRLSEQQQAEQERQRYQQYLKNNDAANGVSQRTGPTMDLRKGGGTVGYQWSTK
jgi:hypothetical protein